MARYGPMVVATCRAVLRDIMMWKMPSRPRSSSWPGGRLRSAGDGLAGWLHRVAYRAAVRLNIDVKRRRRHESEVSATEIPEPRSAGLDFDVRSMVHEEIEPLPDSQRLPVVLRDLDGLTYEQAAGRLQWTAPTVYHRLAKGRKRLRDRLIWRGVTATAVGAMELSPASTMAAVPTAWVRSVVAAATGAAQRRPWRH